uniref:Uncharacterized protein n=1 Tax=Acrobeloides nanus TaxID=290746 RepID=A0A914DRJ5_9BILA
MSQTYGNVLENAVQLAENILKEVNQNILDLNKRYRKHPNRGRIVNEVHRSENILLLEALVIDNLPQYIGESPERLRNKEEQEIF